MELDLDRVRDRDSSRETAEIAPARPERLQRRLAPGASATPPANTNGVRTLSLASSAYAIQLFAEAVSAGVHPTERVQQAAAHGLSGASSSLPHLAAIQQAFGRHDVSSVQAHVGGAAAEGAAAMGAHGFAAGNAVAFASTPDLHLAAHEAAHIVQQRAGVHLKGGVGEIGDAYERHADAVADLVVQGKSAESLLDTMAPGGAAASSTSVQRFAVIQRREVTERNPTAAVSVLQGGLGRASAAEAGTLATQIDRLAQDGTPTVQVDWRAAGDHYLVTVGHDDLATLLAQAHAAQRRHAPAPAHGAAAPAAAHGGAAPAAHGGAAPAAPATTPHAPAAPGGATTTAAPAHQPPPAAEHAPPTALHTSSHSFAHDVTAFVIALCAGAPGVERRGTVTFRFPIEGGSVQAEVEIRAGHTATGFHAQVNGRAGLAAGAADILELRFMAALQLDATGHTAEATADNLVTALHDSPLGVVMSGDTAPLADGDTTDAVVSGTLRGTAGQTPQAGGTPGSLGGVSGSIGESHHHSRSVSGDTETESTYEMIDINTALRIGSTQQGFSGSIDAHLPQGEGGTPTISITLTVALGNGVGVNFIEAGLGALADAIRIINEMAADSPHREAAVHSIDSSINAFAAIGSDIYREMSAMSLESGPLVSFGVAFSFSPTGGTVAIQQTGSLPMTVGGQSVNITQVRTFDPIHLDQATADRAHRAASAPVPDGPMSPMGIESRDPAVH